jgi:hypothetical protein
LKSKKLPIVQNVFFGNFLVCVTSRWNNNVELAKEVLIALDFPAKSTEWFIEDQSSSPTYALATPPPPLSPFRQHVVEGEKGGRGWGRSQIIRRRKRLVFYTSFNTLWSAWPSTYLEEVPLFWSSSESEQVLNREVGDANSLPVSMLTSGSKHKKLKFSNFKLIYFVILLINICP